MHPSDFMALGSAMCWAIAVLVFAQLKEVSSAALNLFKNSVAAAAMALTMWAIGMPFQTDRSLHDWLLLVGSGVVGLAIADTLFFAGMRRLEPSVVAICDCVYAPTMFLLSALVLQEDFRFGLLLGAPLVVIGLLVATWQPRQRPGEPIDRQGVVLVVTGVIGTAVGVVLAKPALPRAELLEATCVRLISGTVALALFHGVRGSFKPALVLFRPQPAWRFALPGTLFGTYFSMLLWLGGMRSGHTARTAVLNQMSAIFVLLLSRLLGERLPAQQWLGAALAVGGACLVLTL